MVKNDEIGTEGLRDRYMEHMPDIDDLTLIILKGHLLVEELLERILNTIACSPEALVNARLSFSQKAFLARALSWDEDTDAFWDLLSALNPLRNDLAHSLEPQKLDDHVQNFIGKFRAVQPPDWKHYDDPSLSTFDKIRYAIVGLMTFLTRYEADAKAYRQVLDKLVKARGD